MLFIGVVVVVLSSTAFMVNDLLTLRQNMASDLEVQTKITAENTLAALQFEDEITAEQTLNALSKHPFVILAEVYPKQSEQAFASYIRDNTNPTLLGDIRSYNMRYSSQYLQYSQPLRTPTDEYIGDIVLMFDRELLYQRVYSYIMIAIVIVIVSVLTAFLLAANLQGVITKPILSLVNLTIACLAKKTTPCERTQIIKMSLEPWLVVLMKCSKRFSNVMRSSLNIANT